MYFSYVFNRCVVFIIGGDKLADTKQRTALEPGLCKEETLHSQTTRKWKWGLNKHFDYQILQLMEIKYFYFAYPYGSVSGAGEPANLMAPPNKHGVQKHDCVSHVIGRVLPRKNLLVN